MCILEINLVDIHKRMNTFISVTLLIHCAFAAETIVGRIGNVGATSQVSIQIYTVLPSVTGGIVAIALITATIISSCCVVYFISWRWRCVKRSEVGLEEETLIPFISQKEGMRNYRDMGETFYDINQDHMDYYLDDIILIESHSGDEIREKTF